MIVQDVAKIAEFDAKIFSACALDKEPKLSLAVASHLIDDELGLKTHYLLF